jgi:hypothetical protein
MHEFIQLVFQTAFKIGMLERSFNGIVIPVKCLQDTRKILFIHFNGYFHLRAVGNGRNVRA